MYIKSLTLYVSNLEKQKIFYNTILGFKIANELENEFAIQVGTTKLTFKENKTDYKYHYCFLIPSNKFTEAVEWLKKRLTIIKIDKDTETQIFESWNAESVYFYDGNENVVEFIARYNLKNDINIPFDTSQIINVNEIGMPSSNKIKELNQQLEEITNSKFWKGSLDRFGTNGNQNGLFLLVNNAIKKEWFPTTIFPEVSPFKTIINVDEKDFSIEYKNEKLKILIKN